MKKLEFINFEDLLNNGPSSRGRRSLRQTVRLVLDESDNSDDDLGLIRAQLTGEDGVVYSYANWMCAWNSFMEATLHFHPHLIYDLFSYQKIVANIANVHKFDAVYSYDIAFRMKVSAQNAMDPWRRSVQWGVLNTELANKYLGPHTLKSVCNSCKTCHGCDITNHAIPIVSSNGLIIDRYVTDIMTNCKSAHDTDTYF